MKLPTQTRAIARAGADVPIPIGAPRGGVAPATVAFSKGWDHYSWHNSHGVDLENERQLILEMIRNSDSAMLRNYANSGECSAFVRTGLHTSLSDSTDHVQVQLGSSSSPWTSTNCPGYTCHIQYHNSPNRPYPTSCFSGLHSGGSKYKK